MGPCLNVIPKGVSPRLVELDGLRGLAALAVLLGHIANLVPATPLNAAIQDSPLRIFWSAGAAVHLFFVMSGFVLSLPFLDGDSRLAYRRFVLLRFFRIYPAYWLALAISLLAIAAYRPERMAGLNEWAAMFWTHGLKPLDLALLAKHLVLLRSFDANLINPPAWTLVIEMRMSLLLPFAIMALRGRNPGIRAAVVAVAATASAVAHDFFHYLPMFMIGAILARFWQPVIAYVRSRTSLVAAMLGGLALLAYGNEHFIRLGQSHVAVQWMTAGGSALLIPLAVARSRLGKVLTLAPVQFFGHISYSLYLLHFPILMTVVCWMRPVLGLAAAAAIAVPVILVASWLSYRMIELPAMRLGRSAVRRRRGPSPARFSHGARIERAAEPRSSPSSTLHRGIFRRARRRLVAAKWDASASVPISQRISRSRRRDEPPGAPARQETEDEAAYVRAAPAQP